MEEGTIFFAKHDIYQKIKRVGGVCNDSKDRPIVCLIQSKEYNGLYWGIPIGNWNHRDELAQARIKKYLNYPKNDIRSCYYHVGRTTTKSIFFITDAMPITEDCILKYYKGFDKKPYRIKNKSLLQELDYKLSRILSIENEKNNYFRQHITDVKNILIYELEQKQAEQQVASALVDDDGDE